MQSFTVKLSVFLMNKILYNLSNTTILAMLVPSKYISSTWASGLTTAPLISNEITSYTAKSKRNPIYHQQPSNLSEPLTTPSLVRNYRRLS